MGRPEGGFVTFLLPFSHSQHCAFGVYSQCMGVRFSVGKLMEIIYVEASSRSSSTAFKGWLQTDANTKFTLDGKGMDNLRSSLGHPLKTISSSIQCVVSSVNGLDGTSSSDRLVVASRLWAEGISTEYLSQSGAIASLLRHNHQASARTASNVSDWLLCLCLSIQFNYMLYNYVSY